MREKGKFFLKIANTNVELLKLENDQFGTIKIVLSHQNCWVRV